MDWLMKIDPNVVLLLVTPLASWLWAKVSGKKQASFTSLIDSIIGTFAHEVLDKYSGEDIASYLKTVRAYIDNRIWSVAAKRGVPRNALTERLVDGAIEKWSAWVAGQLLVLRAKADSKAPLSSVLK